MAPTSLTRPVSIARWQWGAGGVYLVILSLILSVLYSRDRQQEWQLRNEQAQHRLDLAYELITRDLQRVKSDLGFLAQQSATVNFDASSAELRSEAEAEFVNFLKHKLGYQQVRLLSMQGQEQLRVDRTDEAVQVTPIAKLQDKRSRYYFQESLPLEAGEVFISDFDLNQEFGVIEQPLRPVVRFLTPVLDRAGEPRSLLVINYLGSPLLNDLRSISMPGQTWLAREDGHYLLAADGDNAWGWLLGHERTFSRQFPDAWRQRQQTESCVMTSAGAFAFREIQLQRMGSVRDDIPSDLNSMYIISHLDAAQVFARSNLLLGRLSLLGLVFLLPVLWLVRLWAGAAQRRQQQTFLLAESEAQLRELSSRLVRIQEDERKAISREIHDQLGQQVTAINLDLKLAARSANEDMRPQLDRAIQESERLLDNLHDFAGRIRPVELDDLGLHDALESHLDEFSQRSGVAVEFDDSLDNLAVPAVVAENVYRLIQESLNNVLKHASATRVRVELNPHDPPSDQDTDNRRWLQLRIADDGVGVAESNRESSSAATLGGPAVSGRGLGMLGMRERVELLGGAIAFDSQSDGGTVVTAQIPLVATDTEQIGVVRSGRFSPGEDADPFIPPRGVSS